MPRLGIVLLATLAVSTPIAPAWAASGQLEINATCAVQTGCFPGDAPGYPVTINRSGAYRLTSNLLQTEFFGGTPPTTAIRIETDSVDVDLAGFVIGCRNPLGGSCSGNAKGVADAPPEDEIRMVRIANGHVEGMPGRGIEFDATRGAIVENMRVRENGRDGIVVFTDAKVRDCIVEENGGVGIQSSTGAEIEGNVVRESAADGIRTKSAIVRRNRVIFNFEDGVEAESSVITENVVKLNYARGIDASLYSNVMGNTVTGNTGVGIYTTIGTNVTGNAVTNNGGAGLEIATAGAYRDNMILDNTGGTVIGGTDAGGNVCGASTTCP